MAKPSWSTESYSRSRRAFEDGIILWNCRIQERELSLPKISSVSRTLPFPALQVPVFNNSTISSTNLSASTSSENPTPAMSGGGGAPRRTGSGRVISDLRGHPDIRYHQKNTLALQNSIRYHFDRESINKYKSDLDKQIEDSRNLRRKSEDKGIELVSAMRRHSRSLPKLNTNLNSTDVTSTFVISPRLGYKGANFNTGNSGSSYRDTLRDQSLEKVMARAKIVQDDVDSSRKHFETWDNYWGRPGAGAPQKLLKKEKLLKLIHKYY